MKIYSLAILLLFQFPVASPIADSQPNATNKSASANIVFKSVDGGQTWQDISEGLPETLLGDDVPRDNFFANDSGLFITAGNQLFQNKRNATAPFWNTKPFPAGCASTAPGNTGVFAYNYSARFAQYLHETTLWSPTYRDLQRKGIRTIFEAAGGNIFIGCDDGLYKSADAGKSWKKVRPRGWVMKMVESSGVLLATSQVGIVRSADGGETWETVISEGGVGIALEHIKGGFAAITYNTESKTRRVRTSYDDGKTWQAIDAGLKGDQLIASIVQVGEDFFCGHPTGIFKSSDKGKTWQLLLPSIEEKVFNLFVSGNVIYAVPRPGGC